MIKNIIIFILIMLYFIYTFLKPKKINEKMIDKELKFIHIPKNAGTSIEDLAQEHNIKWGRFDNSNLELKEENSKINCVYWHNYLFSNKKYDYFAIVRNPYEKIKSEYYYRKKMNQTENYNLNDWINYILSKDPKDTLNCHYIPQYKFIYDRNIKKVKHVIKMEDNLSKELEKLFKLYDIKINLRKFKKNNKSTDKKDELSRNSINLINKYYAKDFKYFGYEML